MPDAAALDEAWDAPDDEKENRPAAQAAVSAVQPPGISTVSEAARVADSLTMQGGPRGSLPDPVELLRDGARPATSGPTAPSRGSVVDPLELYGAVTPSPSKPPEQSLPKVMVQVPAKPAPDVRAFSDPKPKAASLTDASARTAAAIADAEAKSRAAIAAAEAKAAAATLEASSAPKPKVDLPPRVEPRPFPKPPPRRAGATETGEHPKLTAVADKPAPKPVPAEEPRRAAADKPPPQEKPAPGKLQARPGAKPILMVPPLPAPSRALNPEAIWDVGPLNDELGEDEIQVDLTPDTPQAGGAGTSAAPSSDSGRFDLHQLMAAGPKSSKKGLADSDLLSLAGDLFTDTGPGKLVPADLSALPKRGRSMPPAERLLAPVAVAPSPVKVIAVPDDMDLAKAFRPSKLRMYAPWALLPVVALGVALIMVWRGPSSDPVRTATTSSAGVTSATDVPITPPPPVRTTEPRGDTTAAPPATATTSAATASNTTDTKSETSGAQGTWKPPSSPTASTGAGTTTAAPAVTTPATATTTTKTATAEAPPSGGNDFNASAARSALRSAAGAASGCPSDKPGVANVSITFAPSGRVTSSVVSGAFAGTTTGGCIAAAMRSATVPPFDGGPVSVSWKVTIR